MIQEPEGSKVSSAVILDFPLLAIQLVDDEGWRWYLEVASCRGPWYRRARMDATTSPTPVAFTESAAIIQHLVTVKKKMPSRSKDV
jgi:hypothetical protein